MTSTNFFSYRPSKKTIFLIALFIIIGIVGIGLAPDTASARAGQPVLKGKASVGNVINRVAGVASFTASSIALVFGVLWLIQYFLSTVLTFLAGGLDFMMALNVGVVPASISVVQLGWTTLRDVSNAFFILVLIWISITIILGIEKYGGKQLLFRAIAVALLINFSLAFVAAVFGFANLFAGEFYKKYPTKQVQTPSGNTITSPATADYIGEKLAIGTLYTPMTATAAQRMFDEQGKIIGAGEPSIPAGQAPSYSHFAFGDALGVQTAHAGWGSVLGKMAGYGVCAAVGVATVGVGGLLCGAANMLLWDIAVPAGVTWLLSAGVKAATGADIFTNAAHLALIDLFLFIAVACFAIITLMLIMRYVAVIFLSIVAPLAFLLHIIPGGFGDEYWKKWYTSLFRWAFFLPAFIFLFYISLQFLGIYQEILSPNVRTNAALAGGYYFLFYLLATAFMIAPVIVARKIAGSTADIALGYTTKALTMGLGFAAGGAMAGVGWAARSAAPAIQKGASALAARPILGKVTAPLTRGVTGYLESQNAKVGAERKGIEGWSDDNLAQEVRRSIGARKVAAAQILAERGKISNKLEAAEIGSVLNTATQFNAQMPFMKTAPSLVTPELAARSGISQQNISTKIQEEHTLGRTVNNQQAAVLLVMEKVKPGESANISADEYGKTEVAEAAWKTYSASHISNLARSNPAAMQTLLNHLHNNPSSGKNMKAETYRYFQSNAARGLGLQIDENIVTPPREIQAEQVEKQREEANKILHEEDRQQQRFEDEIGKRVTRLQELEDQLRGLEQRATTLESQNKIQEATIIRNTEIPKLQGLITGLRQRLQ